MLPDLSVLMCHLLFQGFTSKIQLVKGKSL